MSIFRLRPRRAAHSRARSRPVVGVVVAALLASTLPVAAVAPATAAPVGQGFNLNASDLRFILKQIKISEQHAATLTAANPCGTLMGPGADQIPAGGVGVTLPWGLRTVDGSCNNIELPERRTFGTADQVFPRLVPKQLRPAEGGTSYAQTSGIVTDSQPRVVSNLIVDQTADNPAAVAAAGETPVVTPSGAFFIQNVAPDVGLSAPYNSWFTLFGQFFDHGLDLVNKGGRGTVMVPLQPDDPQFVPGSQTNFMALTRATHAGDHEAVNQTSPFVDQSQTYTSHPSHQVFLRAYEDSDPNPAVVRPVATGGLVTGPGDGMATWADVKAHSRTMLGIELSDLDVLNLPLLRTDPYGRFLRGPNGFPQMVVPSAPGGLVEGNPAAPVTTTGATRSGHAFLDDIAHFAVPGLGLTADADTTIGDDEVASTYDDEMLAAHFVAGDGRVNENIGLTTVHHVFHSEHNRLVAEIDGMIHDPATGFSAAEVADWEATNRPAGWDYGERLFQAARFVTEMEYQHLAFEEFIRKVQPAVNPFGEGGTGYHTTINPAIKAEFAHAVYRFGHSMLTESVDRVAAPGAPATANIPLLQAFLNPPAFMTGAQTPEQAAGNVVRGMTRQTGNELDEFVTEALRNELLGLPLDLATLNMARAREAGVPTLNEARRAFYAESDNPALVPYLSWADLSFSLKHAESLPNFIAAYGTHPSILSATTMDAKRAAAYALLYGVAGPDGDLTTLGDNIDPALVPADSYAFMNSAPHTEPDANGDPVVVHNAWTLPDSGVTTTGVDRIDLWVGGLAEKQMVFGGLLGPTFNYVFEGQTEALQDGDRFYYLSRTAGLNLLTQLEGNSFSELIQRNTDVEGLPADSFSRPDLVFNLAALGTSGPVPDDPETPEYNESTLLTREANGTIRYGGPAHVVFNGTPGNNLARASEGDDTIRGNDGNDRMEGGDGADNLIGGLGDDILTDLFGDDVLKGGDGNDTLSSGQGFGGDLNQGGRGDDMIIGGNDITETFAGPGDDLVFAGDGEDTVFGDDGDDWIEGGLGPFNLLQGDNGAPFQDDPNEPGHDVIIGYGGEQDYDSEGGDDIMLAGPGIQRSEGMLGFDFVTHKLDPVAADSDMDISVFLPPAVDTNRDRFDLVESLSGWDKNDILRGDDRVDTDMVGHELTAAGVARVAGLSSILPAPGTSFTGGNILLGGAGGDLIEGRGGNDLIDGDAWLDVQLSAPTAITTDPADTRQVHEGLSTLRADVLAGRVNPGTVDIVRTLRTATSAGTDIALFTGPRADYTVTTSAGVTTVVDNVGTDGTDTLRNVEQLRFSDTTIGTPGPVTVPAAPVLGTVTAGNAAATVAFSTPATGGSAITAFQVEVQSGGAVLRTVNVTAPATSTTITGLTNGTAYQFRVRAVNAAGQGAFSALSAAVIPATVPATPVIGNATPGNTSATVRWTAPTNGGRALTGYQVEVRTGTTIVRTVNVTAPATSSVITALANGTPYRFRVRAINGVGTGAYSALSNIVTPAVVPGAPVIGTATPANASATVRWTAPGNGGSPLTSYQVEVRTGTTIVRTVTVTAPATSTVITALTNGTPYRFRVRAVNAIGTGTYSALSAIVTPVTVPGAPIIRTAVSGVAGGAITATAAWDAPASTGGTPITGYRVRALRMAANGTVLATTVSAIRPATSRSFAMTLPVTGNYRFTVQAVNAVGDGAQSARSNQVIGR